MMHKGRGLIMLIIALGLSFSALAAIYKWVDKDGKVHYSDTPREGAQILKPKANTENQLQFAVPIASKTEQETKVAKISVRIVSPVDQQTIRDNNGDFTVTAMVVPDSAGLSYVLLLDGKPFAESQKQSVFSLTNIDRGEHKLQVLLVDDSNKTQASSSEVTVYLHRFSKLFNLKSSVER